MIMSRVLTAFLQNEKSLKRFLANFSSSPQDIEDFYQESFLRAFAAECNKEIAEPKAFLFKIAKNIALGDIRRRARKPQILSEDTESAEQIIDARQLSAERWWEGRRKLSLLARAVAQLPPQCRKAFLMRRVHGLQYRQIANRMNISVSAVEKHVALGLLKCTAYLQAQGYEPAEFGAARPKATRASHKKTVHRDEE